MPLDFTWSSSLSAWRRDQHRDSSSGMASQSAQHLHSPRHQRELELWNACRSAGFLPASAGASVCSAIEPRRLIGVKTGEIAALLNRRQQSQGSVIHDQHIHLSPSAHNCWHSSSRVCRRRGRRDVEPSATNLLSRYAFPPTAGLSLLRDRLKCCRFIPWRQHWRVTETSPGVASVVITLTEVPGRRSETPQVDSRSILEGKQNRRNSFTCSACAPVMLARQPPGAPVIADPT